MRRESTLKNERQADRATTKANGIKRRRRADGRGPIEKSAVEARQGEIVLGRNARWIFGGCFVLFVLAVLILGPWW